MKDMMDNSDIEFRISQYLDGDLRGQDLLDFQEELQKDIRLQEQVRLYRSLHRQIDELRMNRTVDFDAQRRQILAALERKMLLQRRAVRPLLLRPAMMAAMAAAAVVLVLAATFFGPKGGATSGPAGAPSSPQMAVMTLLPAHPLPETKGELYVQFFPATVGGPETEWPELAQSLEPASGTVLVTFSKSRPTSASPDTLFFAPINRQGSLGDMK